MEKQIKWFSQNHVAANFLMLVVILLGFTTWFKLKKEVFPDLALDAIAISVPFPNASPEEVETGIILPIEDAIRSIEGIKRYTSSSSESLGAVTVEVENGYAVREVMDDVKSKIDGISTFPEEAEKPIYEEFVLKTQVLSVAVSGETDEYTLRKIAQKVRDDLLIHKLQKADKKSVEGVKQAFLTMLRGESKISEVELAAVKPLELSIEISEGKLRQYNLTIDEVAEKLRQSSIDLPGGSIKSNSGDVLIRVQGKLYQAEDFASVDIVANPDGSTLKLGDIASVVDGFEDVEISTQLNGRRTALVNVFASGDDDTLAIAAIAKDYVERIAPSRMPEGISLEVWNDSSKWLNGRINLLMRSMTIGLLLVFIVLALFLRPSLAGLVALGIPVSFAGGIFLMPELGVSINMISLFAFILVLGIVVDDAIVVGENVYGMIRKGMHPREAAWKGTHEVGVVVIFGILTTMAAFTPMIGLDGVSGKIWPNIPYIVIPVLAFSLIQSKLVLPAHLALLKPRKENEKLGLISKVQHAFADGLEWCVEHLYRPALRLCLQYRYVVLVGFIAVFGLTGMLSQTKMKFEFMPKVEGDIISVKIEMPFGVKFETTEQAVRQIEEAARKLGEDYKDKHGNPAIINVLASAGSQPFVTGFGTGGSPTGSHIGEVTVELAAAVDRPGLSAERLINIWREEIGGIPGAVSVAFKQETAAGGNALDIEITGQQLEQVKAASNYLVEELKKIEGMKDIYTDDRLGKREIAYTSEDITATGKALGFTHQDVARQVRAAIFGAEVQRIQRGRDEVKVMVRFPKTQRESLDTLEKMKLRSRENEEVALASIVTGSPSRGQATIHHIDGNRAIKLSADVDRSTGANANEIVQEFQADVLDDLSAKFPGVSWSFQGEQRDQAESLNQMGVKFIFALILMYILIAIPLKSYLQPLIIMSVIPFGMVGAVIGHFLLGYDLSVMSVCGLIALAGVVVNDSLVLVEYVNRHRSEGGSMLDAVWNAGARRFRPIMLTSLTTFAGLMPMLTETDMQARFLIPMAISLGFGILFATCITLVLVPSIYLILEDLKWLTGFGTESEEEGE